MTSATSVWSRATHRGEPAGADAIAAHLAGHGVPETRRDLRHHAASCRRTATAVATAGESTTPALPMDVQVRGGPESTLGELLRDAAVAGEGIGLFSLGHVAGNLRAGRLVQVLPGRSIPQTAVHAAVP